MAGLRSDGPARWQLGLRCIYGDSAASRLDAWGRVDVDVGSRRDVPGCRRSRELAPTQVACAVFGLADVAFEPSPLALLFFVSQLPFAAGALLLARATAPENLNRALFWGPEMDARVTDEMVLRGLLDRGDVD